MLMPPKKKEKHCEIFLSILSNKTNEHNYVRISTIFAIKKTASSHPTWQVLLLSSYQQPKFMLLLSYFFFLST
ncbi:unnamed protein product [Rotaria magnacalcarata]